MSEKSPSCDLCSLPSASFMIWELDRPTLICSRCDKNRNYVMLHDSKRKYISYYKQKINTINLVRALNE